MKTRRVIELVNGYVILNARATLIWTCRKFSSGKTVFR